MDSHDTFPQRVWQIVASIPEGYVATYGDIAQLAGSPRAARQVGGVLKRLPEGSTLPGIGSSTATAISPLPDQICSASARRYWRKASRFQAADILICSTIAGFIEGKKMPL
jgi:hypothetical protein